MKLYQMEDSRWCLEVPTTEGRTQTILYLTNEEMTEIKNMFIQQKPNMQKHMLINGLHLTASAWQNLHTIACRDGILSINDDDCIFVDKLPTKLVVDISYLSDKGVDFLPNHSLKDCVRYAKFNGCSHIDFVESNSDPLMHIIDELKTFKGERLCSVDLSSLKLF